jgi:hypothetical protein
VLVRAGWLRPIRQCSAAGGRSRDPRVECGQAGATEGYSSLPPDDPWQEHRAERWRSGQDLVAVDETAAGIVNDGDEGWPHRRRLGAERDLYLFQPVVLQVRAVKLLAPYVAHLTVVPNFHD